MASASDSQQTPHGSERSGSVMRRLLYGQVVSSDLFARNWLALILGVFMVLAYISGKYSCQTKMEEVKRLTHQYEIVSAELVRCRSSYMSKIRESSMQAMVDSLHLNLSVHENPPYRLKSN
ncbi:MAG: FtsL-like putative cell division protein [Firmicutes bacterium]|nr:FtsL-like putative cell division protein [Bacillota bacterium]MCM1401071.1 FtsL-like putative cell division protein [Bacteroides sp.]MCM1476990.1 FtsL-like putative cell division protein [Bacteroides sp.]